ncbi:MAG: hypothetical protein K2I76_04195 [Malacoplasma sp.]|nr:hypothetical protein [Malacoplasma sp.]
MKIKLITNYNEKDFSHTELCAIDYINQNPILFLKAVSFKDFCKNMPFSETSLQRIAKKFGFSSSLKMRAHFLESYLDKLNDASTNKNTSYKFINKKNFKLDKMTFESFLDSLKKCYTNIEWNIIRNLEEKILSSKAIYVYQSDPIFNFDSFDFFGVLADINIYRIQSFYRFEILKKIGIEKNSVFIMTKAVSKPDDFEKEIVNFFIKKDIEIFLFSGLEGIFPDLKNNIVIGNYKNTEIEYEKVLEFKSLYDSLINIVINNIFSEFFKSAKNRKN